MINFVITDEHIDTIEKELFPDFDFSGGKKVFDEQRRNVIKCLETKDIVACAGSGKTTTLIAKLMILDRFFMAFPENKGICVLTHTNVAIDEIKARLGVGSRLLSYPNFFGTIQSFVDKYFTVPKFVECFGYKPKDIGSFTEQMEIEFRINFTQKEQKYFEWYFDDVSRPEYLFRKMTISKNDIGSYNSRNIPEKERTDLVCKFKKIRCRTIKKGFLDFDDAYLFANKYIKKYGIYLKKVFSERFAFVFIDEMQDTEPNQKHIIDSVFDESTTIIQGIGDLNQAIYSKSQAITWKVRENSLSITGSKRFHNKIAYLAESISVNNALIQGNQCIGYQPIIILFKDKDKDKIVKKFSSLVAERSLHYEDLKKYPIKAVGGITYFNGKDVITDYFPNYKKPDKKIPNYTLRSFLKHKPEEKSSIYYRKVIIEAMIKMLSLVSDSRYNETKFIDKIKAEGYYDIFSEKLLYWCRNLYLNQDIHSEVSEYLKNDLLTIFQCSNSPEKTDYFLTKDGDKFQIQTNEIAHVFPYKDDNGNTLFEVQVGTVHSVKGETHTATLYLETPEYDSKEYDLKQILEYLKGNYTVPPKELERVLRIAHVAITRPKYLLCLAMHENSLSNVEQDIKDLQKTGWKIEYINE